MSEITKDNANTDKSFKIVNLSLTLLNLLQKDFSVLKSENLTDSDIQKFKSLLNSYQELPTETFLTTLIDDKKQIHSENKKELIIAIKKVELIARKAFAEYDQRLELFKIPNITKYKSVELLVHSKSFYSKVKEYNKVLSKNGMSTLLRKNLSDCSSNLFTALTNETRAVKYSKQIREKKLSILKEITQLFHQYKKYSLEYFRDKNKNRYNEYKKLH